MIGRRRDMSPPVRSILTVSIRATGGSFRLAVEPPADDGRDLLGWALVAARRGVVVRAVEYYEQRTHRLPRHVVYDDPLGGRGAGRMLVAVVFPVGVPATGETDQCLLAVQALDFRSEFGGLEMLRPGTEAGVGE